MNNKKQQPFTISRSNSARSSFSFLDKSLSNSFDETNGPTIKRQNSFLSRQNSLILPQPSYKNCYNIFKTDLNIMPELLEQYTQANLYYRDEEFSQQAETFITKIAQDKKIPKEYRAKYPIYQILVSLSKIFMLNEYEIITFSCTLDHCNWKIDEVVYHEEADNLEEFPATFGNEISGDCKRFIIYLLIITFSLKQYLNDKSEIDPIQAYCEKICDNFQSLYNRWTRLSSIQRFNYSAPEINRKYKNMAKKEYSDRLATPKDYNMMADEIMRITGSYASKNKPEAPPPQPVPQPKPKPQNTLTSKIAQAFSEFVPHTPKPFYAESPFSRNEKVFSRSLTLESIEDLARIPTSSRAPIQRQDTLSQLLTNFSSLRRQESFELMDKGNKKKVKWDNDKMGEVESRDKSMGMNSNLNSQNDGDDDLALPALSKKASNISQTPDDMPSFSRLNSNLSFLYEK